MTLINSVGRGFEPHTGQSFLWPSECSEGINWEFLSTAIYPYIIYRRIFVYTFCLINICLSLSDDANKIKTLNNC